MELIKNCKNETLKDFINEKIKNYNYISIKEEKNKDPKNLRLLSKIFNVNENEIHLLNNLNNSNKLNNYNLRNLEKYEVLQQKIIYAYTLGKTNVAGLKYEIMVVMSFIPQNGQINYKVVCRTDKNEIIIGNYEIKTNYGKLITVVNQITEIFSQKILEFKNSFDLKLKEWEKNISDKLINLINAINNPINIVDIFNEPLTKLCDDIKSYSLNDVSIKDLIINTDKYLKDLKEEVNKENEINTQKILQQSETDFSDFININDEIFNDFHKNVKELIDFILDKLKGLEIIDFDCYYRILDILNVIFNEYENFSNKILPAISKNKENFISYSNKFTDNNLENILNEIEQIPNILYENFKQSLTEEDRIKMIESLNNYRKTIDEMLKLIYDKINNIYSNLIEDKNILNQNLNNINEKFEAFKINHDELLNKVKNFMSFNNNFEIYNKHLSLLDSIHEKCEFNRIKLMSNYFTIPISKLEDTYLTENLIKDIKENLDSKALEIINLIKKNHPVSSSLLNYENEAKNILTNYFGYNLIEKYFDIFTYDSFLINQTKKFYDDLSQYFDEFNTIFYKNNFEKEYINYVDVPNEIITKLTQILDYQKNYYDHPAEQLNEIIYNSLNNLISESYEKLKNIIKNDYNIISSNINKSNSTLVNEIDNLFNSLISFIETEKKSKNQKNYIKSILNLSDDDPFKLKIKSLQNENDFYINIKLIKLNVESIYKKDFCMNFETLKTCKIEILNLNERHNFNMAKIRNEIEHYKIIQNYVCDLLTDDLLVDLSGKKFSDLFLENIDFSGESIKNAILNFIKKKNDEELEILNPFINQFKNIYKQAFEENLNEQMITNELEILANSAFKNKLIIDNSNFIDLIKQKFKTFEEPYLKFPFYLHSNDLQNSYNSLVNNLKNIPPPPKILLIISL